MSLLEREVAFKNLTSKTHWERPSPLIAVCSPPRHLFEQLQMACSLYLYSCLPDKSQVTVSPSGDWATLVEAFARQTRLVKNMTPNGMLVPKRQLILEYNMMVRAFADLVNSLGIGDGVRYWINPPNLRYKAGTLDEKLLERDYASEHIHSESWIPLNTNRCATIFIPILGDIPNNYVELLEPPRETFREEWLSPRSSYTSGQEISKQYRRIAVPYELGKVIIAEVATMHVTRRNAGSGPRVSFDVNFILGNADAPLTDPASAVKYEDLLDIGQRKLFIFDDDLNHYVDTAHGSTHPANRRRIVDFATFGR